MLNFTTKIKTLCLCAISLLFSSAVLADTYPTSDELIGRYHFSGKCSVEAPSIPAVNDYDVIILPAEGENNVSGHFRPVKDLKRLDFIKF